ncbi:MAG: hypothetical protein ABTA16_06135 [Niallia sp.]
MLLNLPFPIQTESGIQLIGITCLLLMITAISLMMHALEKYHGRMFLLTIILFFAIPHFAINTYQNTFASGIYAVSYERQNSNCHYQMIDDHTLQGICICNLQFENHSKKDSSFSVEFYDKYSGPNDEGLASTMNKAGPYEITLKGKGLKQVQIEANIDVSEMKTHFESGDESGMNIILQSERKARKL